VKKWPKHEVIGLAVIAAAFVGASALLWAGTPRPMAGTTVYYEVDVFSGRVNPSWGAIGTSDVLDLFTVERTAGVAATVPGDLGFRGVVLTGPDLPGGGALDAIRVVQSGYYLEFADGAVRFVEDPAVWPPIRAELEANLEPEVWDAVAGIGGFSSAP
jgi:hypothetical protein